MHGNNRQMNRLNLTGDFKQMCRIMVLSAAVGFLVPTTALAERVEGISLIDSDSGDSVRISTDQPLAYQVFDLDGPPRLVITFPKAKMGDDVTPVRASGDGVNSVFAIKDSEGVRIEIGLSDMLGYNIEEQDKVLTVKFAAVETGKDMSASAAVIKDIEVKEHGPVTELILRGDNMDANHNAYLTNQGQTMILDFWGGSSKLPKEHYGFATQQVEDVTVGSAEGRVRLVVGLLPSAKVSHQIEATANEMVVRFGGEAPKIKKGMMTVEQVAFQPDDRIAHLTIRTDSTKPVVNMYEKDGNVIVDVAKASLAAGQERSQDVSAFPGPIKQVDSYNVEDSVRIVARLREKVSTTTFQQGNVLTVTMEPRDLALARAAKGEAGEKQLPYAGQKVTFKFKDIDIRNALQLISEMSNLNIIMGDDVKGTLTMNLVDVPWDQALDLILSSKGLGKQQEGNVLRIAPLGVLRKENKEALQDSKDTRLLEPLVTEALSLNYARVDDLKKMLEEAKKTASSTTAESASDGTKGGLLSTRGTYIVDQRTNTLIVTDTTRAINNVKRFIKIIDKPIKQILIESRIIEANDSFTREFGIRWGGQVASKRTAASGGPALQVGDGAGFIPTGNRGYLVDLPSASGSALGGTVGVSIGAISRLMNLDLELSAAEVDGIAKIVSSPRVLTANGEKSVISQGVDVPFVTPGTATSPPTVTFKKAELKLEVTPQVAANNNVIMAIEITKDSPTGETVQGNPILATKKVTTNLQVKDGDTIVIGGVYTRSTSNNQNGVPGLKEVPILGWLFKQKTKLDNKTELLIFLTPTVVDNGGKES